MQAKKDKSRFFSYALTVILALLKWGATRIWNMISFWRAERRKPKPDRQKLDRTKAVTGLLAIAAAFGIAAWFVLGAVASAASAFVDRKYALYAGMFLLLLGVNIARRVPSKRKLGLGLAAAGALLCAYGAGYIG